MKCAYSGSLCELNFLAIHSGYQITMPGLAQCGVSALCAHREHVTEGMWAPNYFRSQQRTNRSSAICKNSRAAPQTTYSALEANDSTAQLGKVLTAEFPTREPEWLILNPYCRCPRYKRHPIQKVHLIYTAAQMELESHATT